MYSLQIVLGKKISNATNDLTMSTFQPVVFSGPSGTGKSTLVQRLMKEFDDCFAFSISRTLYIILEIMFNFNFYMLKNICYLQL